MRYAVLGMLCAAAVIAYVQRSAISVPTQAMQAELAMTERGLGLVMAAWYWGYALFQVPAGLLADRIGSKPALVLYAVLWSLLTGAVGLADDGSGLLALWTLMGCAQAGLFPCAAKAIGAWFPETGRAFASGLLAASMALGAALAPAVTAWLLQSLSWQQTFALYALPGLAWAGLFAAAVPPAREPAPPPVPAGAVGRRMLTSGPMLLLCGQQFLRAAAMAFFFTWFPRFLQETRGVSWLESGELAAWPGAGAMLGGLLGGAASDWLLRRTGSRRLSRQGVAVAGMVCCAALTVAAYFVRDARPAVLLISLGAFLGTFGGVSGYTVAIEFGGRRVGAVFSTMNMCGNVGAGLFPLAVGWLVERHGSWDLVLLLFAAIFAADAVCWALLNPRRPLFEDEP
jgi:MFS family permease